MKKDLIEEFKNEFEESKEDEEEEEDLTGSVWMPILIDPKDEKNKTIFEDPNVKSMDLAAISEKEVFVRKANLVSIRNHLTIVE